MKTKPILFSTEMVQAILDGRKTQTRRVVQLTNYHPSLKHKQPEVMKIEDFKVYDANGDFDGNLRMKYGNIGDILWVRETFTTWNEEFCYKADNLRENKLLSWKPSIHMPKEAARIFLKIKNVRVERLHDVSRGDCMSEGCPFPNIARETNPKEWFTSLWKSINGEESWNSNPWVWVIEFERVEKPLNF